MNEEQKLMFLLIKQGYTAKEISVKLKISYNRAWKQYAKVIELWRGWDKALPQTGDVLEYIDGELWEVTTTRAEYMNIKSKERDSHRTLSTRMWLEGKVRYRHYGEKERLKETTRPREPKLYDTLKRGGEQYIICEILEDGYRVKKNEKGSHKKKIPKEFERKGYRLLNYAPVEVRREDVSQ